MKYKRQFLVKYQTQEFSLLNYRHRSSIQEKYRIHMDFMKAAEVYTNCFHLCKFINPFKSVHSCNLYNER